MLTIVERQELQALTERVRNLTALRGKNKMGISEKEYITLYKQLEALEEKLDYSFPDSPTEEP